MHMDTITHDKNTKSKGDNRGLNNQKEPNNNTTLAQRLTRIPDKHLADTIFRLWIAIIFLFVLWAYTTYMLPNQLNSAIMNAYIELQKQQVPNNLHYAFNYTN